MVVGIIPKLMDGQERRKGDVSFRNGKCTGKTKQLPAQPCGATREGERGTKFVKLGKGCEVAGQEDAQLCGCREKHRP